MRPKVVLTILGFGLAAILFLVVARHEGTSDTRSPQTALDRAARQSEEQGKSAVEVSVANQAVSRNGKASARNEGKASAVVATSPGASGNLSHEDYVDKRVGELMDLAMNDDSASLNSILSELNNNDADIRKGAIEAVKQFGSMDAVPKLEEAAARSTNGTEKKELEEAIEFLKLPPLTARRN